MVECWGDGTGGNIAGSCQQKTINHRGTENTEKNLTADGRGLSNFLRGSRSFGTGLASPNAQITQFWELVN